MRALLANPRGRRKLGSVLAVGSAATLMVGCTGVGRGGPGRPAPTTMPGMSHGGDDHSGGGGMDHSHENPARLNHDPTPAQKQWAYKLIRDTAAKLKGMTTVKAVQLGYQNIGDGVHYTNAKNRHDGREFDPEAIESLVFNPMTGQIQAAMYNLEPTTTIDNVKDYVGNWIVFHNHDQLCWPRNNPDSWKITPCGIGEKRPPVLMAHVWIIDTPYAKQCGAFATITGVGVGSCIPQLLPSKIIAGQNPL